MLFLHGKQFSSVRVHVDQNPVVQDVGAGTDPKILGFDVGQRQNQARRADDDQALRKIPVVGRKMDQAE